MVIRHASFSNGGCGIRTHDLLITNQLLCQLSYASLFFNTPHQATATTPADSMHGEYHCRANSQIYATIVAPQGGLALRPPNRDKKIREAVESHRKDTQKRPRVRFARAVTGDFSASCRSLPCG